MSKYSEVIGSFIRTGLFPLEANYIFNSEQELKDFYSDEINATTMHEGLLRVVRVDETGKLSLWWVVKKGNEDLEFKKLIDLESFENVSNLEEALNKEISDRKLADDAIWGDEDHTIVNQDLNSLKKLADAVSDLQDNTSDLNDLLKAVVGTEEDNVVEYLKTLPYTTLTEIIDALYQLTNSATGFIKNLQGEETPTLKLNVVNQIDKTTIKGHVKISPEDSNQILRKDNGIYLNIDTEYSDGRLFLKVNGNIIKEHNLGLPVIGIQDTRYDADTESIIVDFELQTGKTKTLRIPVSGIISEWEVDNTHPTKVVELVKERVEAGGSDRLSADVRISEKKYNILEKDNNTLFVKGTADNIVFEGDLSVEGKINSLEAKVDKLNSLDIDSYYNESSIEKDESTNVITLLGKELLEGEWSEYYDELILNPATEEKAGLMSASDKTIFNQLPNDIQDLKTNKADKSEIPSLEGYATQQWVEDKKYATEQWVEDKGYLTEHQSLEEYAKTVDVTSAIDSKVEELNLSQYETVEGAADKYQPKGDYLTQEDFNLAIDDVATKTWVNEQNYATKEEAQGYADQVKKDLLGDDLEETFNTLKAVQDWADEHGTEYAELVETVNNKANASDLDNYVDLTSNQDIEGEKKFKNIVIYTNEVGYNTPWPRLEFRRGTDSYYLRPDAGGDLTFDNRHIAFDDSVVNLTSNQEIKGIKTFTGENPFNSGSGILVKGEIPSIYFKGNDDNFKGAIGFSSNGRLSNFSIGPNQYLNTFAYTSEIPASLSQLENDKNFITSSDISNFVTSDTLNNYLPLTGGTLTGNLEVEGEHSVKAKWLEATDSILANNINAANNISANHGLAAGLTIKIGDFTLYAHHVEKLLKLLDLIGSVDGNQITLNGNLTANNFFKS